MPLSCEFVFYLLSLVDLLFVTIRGFIAGSGGDTRIIGSSRGVQACFLWWKRSTGSGLRVVVFRQGRQEPLA